MSTLEHGYGPYTNGCRCDVCKKAKADYMRERRAAARKIAQKHTRGSDGKRPTASTAWAVGAERYVAPIAKHGSRFGYEEHGCRCFDCTEARSVDDRAHYQRKTGAA